MAGNLAVLEDVAVDAGGDGGQLGDEVHGVLEGVLPVLVLLHALGVGLGEGGLVLESGDGEGELGHGVEVAGAAVDELLDELGDIGAGGPLGGEVADLLLGGDLAGQEEPEETFGEGLLAAGSLGELLLAFGDGAAAEADTLLAVEDGAFPDQRLDATGAAVDLVEGDFADDFVAVVFLQLLDLLLLLREAGGEGLLEGLKKAGIVSCNSMDRRLELTAFLPRGICPRSIESKAVECRLAGGGSSEGETETLERAAIVSWIPSVE